MGYKSLADCVKDLDQNGHLLRISEEVDGNLEMAEIHRQVYGKGGPAILFENIKGCQFPALSNLYGTHERTRFLFRDSIDNVKKVTHLKNQPQLALKQFRTYAPAGWTAIKALPKRVKKGPVLKNKTSLSALPKIVSWPDDGGAFITLPQVCTLPPADKNIMNSNLGMYRIQLDGNDYENDEIGLHYQLHRGIGVHHKAYLNTDEAFKVSIFVGGPPAHAFSAIMPMPEGISEFTFAGMLNNRRFRYALQDGYIISTDADFVITGIVNKDQLKMEGPFGDHLGYYSLAHLFPYMKVENVYHRDDAIWHFTVVGRPPQEDSSFGYLIHELVSDISKEEFPGIHSIHAVDESGVHPLLLAVGSERYMPFREEKPEEILTQANHLLGKGQTSLAKYLWIANHYDNPDLDAHDIEAFFTHMLERVNWENDLHFYTKTTIDTLDYSGNDWNAGSKVVVAAVGKEPIRTLAKHTKTEIDSCKTAVVAPGILAVQLEDITMKDFISNLNSADFKGFPLLVVCDDAAFLAADFSNFLWVTFTRSNPAIDIYGIDDFIENKHWGCKGALIIDARIKPHHAPELIPNKEVQELVKERFDNLLKK